MKIDFPDHPIGPWVRTPWYLFWRTRHRRRNWRWTVDWRGCFCKEYWQYGDF